MSEVTNARFRTVVSLALVPIGADAAKERTKALTTAAARRRPISVVVSALSWPGKTKQKAMQLL